MSTFRKYDQKFVAVKIFAAATDFPLKIPRIPSKKGKKGEMEEISLNKVATAQNIKNRVGNFFKTLKG